MTVARSRGTCTAADGRATPSDSTVSPISSSAKVRCRRQPGRRGATLPSSSTLLNRATYFLRRSCSDDVRDQRRRDDDQQQQPGRARGNVISATPARRSGGPTGEPAAGDDEADDVVDPVAVGAQLQVPGAGVPQRGRRSARAAPAPRRRSRCRTLAVGGLHLELTSGLGVDEGDQPGRGQLQLARVEHLDAEQLVPVGERAQRAFPGALAGRCRPRKSETTATRPRRRGGRRSDSSMRGEVGAAAALGARGVAAMRAHQVARVVAAAAGRDAVRSAAVADDRADPVAAAHGQVHDRGDRGEHQFALLGQRRCRSPCSATGRRPARSPARGRRSSAGRAGSVVRAVTGQSMRRTSSPGAYCRDSPASLPGPGTSPR